MVAVAGLFWFLFLKCSSSRDTYHIGKVLYIQGGFMDLLRVVCAFFVPPLGVALQVGLGPHFWINILLTLCGYFPGLIHALYVILREAD
jgi:uncharacterized membrane protein YqaE (UPF0057 family)